MPIVIILLYIVILACSVSISGYLSYHGLLSMSGDVTLALVVFLMAAIVAGDVAVSYFRSVRRSYFLPILAFLIAALFSIASNFNHLYSNFMREEVTKTTVAEQLQVFRDNLVDTRTRLEKLDVFQGAERAKAELSVEFDNLYQQIRDPLRPGCGVECRSHLEEVERIIGHRPTNLAIPPLGSDPDTIDDWYQRYRATAEDIFAKSLAATDYDQVDAALDRIGRALVEFDTPERIIDAKGGLDALSEMSSISRDIEREANAILDIGQAVSHEPIDPTLGRLGEIAYAFQNGFGEMPNPLVTVLSIVMASVVDLLPFLLAFAFFGPGRLEPLSKNSADRASGGRQRGNTIV